MSKSHKKLWEKLSRKPVAGHVCGVFYFSFSILFTHEQELKNNYNQTE